VKSEASAVRACTDGKAGGIAVSLGALSASVPEMEATEIPYLFDDYAQADKAFKAAEPLMAEILKEKGFIYAVRGENGFRQWASKTRFLTKAEDFKGRAMRSQPANVHKAMYSTLGATPNPLQISDVPTSLTNNVVDGYDNTLLFARLANWSNEVQYVTMSNHIYQGAAVLWCKPWFDKLPADLQAVLTVDDAAMEKLERTGLELVRVFNDKLMPDQYKKLGKELKELTGSERTALKTALAPVEAGVRAGSSAKGIQLLALLKKSR
jgi:TRAP-type C4-dicarboxylate transport system substrate-binding protein